MNTKVCIFICVFALSILVGCEEPYRMEMAIPLAGVSAAQHPQPAADPLDVQIAVEKIVSIAGLKPEIPTTAESDLFSMADDAVETASATANTRTWKHPAYPVFLSMTRHAGEFVLLLNYAVEEKADSNATKLYKSLEQQLSELPVKLVPPQKNPNSND
jgi:hypothetical protein